MRVRHEPPIDNDDVNSVVDDGAISTSTDTHHASGNTSAPSLIASSYRPPWYIRAGGVLEQMTTCCLGVAAQNHVFEDVESNNSVFVLDEELDVFFKSSKPMRANRSNTSPSVSRDDGEVIKVRIESGQMHFHPPPIRKAFSIFSDTTEKRQNKAASFDSTNDLPHCDTEETASVTSDGESNESGSSIHSWKTVINKVSLIHGEAWEDCEEEDGWPVVFENERPHSNKDAHLETYSPSYRQFPPQPLQIEEPFSLPKQMERLVHPDVPSQSPTAS